MLHQADGRLLGEDGKDVEAEGRGELEARQDQDLRQQPAVFRQAGRFGGLDALEVLEEFEIFDLPPEVGVAPDGVVVGEGDDVETLGLGRLKDLQR